MKLKLSTLIAVIPLGLGLSSTASAALVHAGGNVSLVNGVVVSPQGIGAASNGGTTAPPNGQVYSNDRNGGTGDYFASGPNFVFDIDLGTAYILDSIAFFNRDNNPNRNAVREFSAEFSLDASFGDIGDTSTGPFIATNTGPGQQDFAVAPVSAQYVRITITDNYFGIGGGAGGDRVGFNDFQFNAVPEPSSAALLGLGGLALILRRRK
ncbi:hypothetical protein NT6N_21080 [Oceaniferula spumae]|uniref:F5/8 type C domain-containing protein n=1 Tax=Oceaniferula spumae TaxID=2979115 RepID=A0AAT9FM96_9BACT